jgi:fimbrial chaperone protein
MSYSSIKAVCAVFALGLSTLGLSIQQASANLLINPTRVQFNPDTRTADITLINTSEVTTTYRLEWSEKKANATGGYTELTPAEAARFPTASGMLRYSPRQVTLKPKERQTIKVAVRRPQGLAAGEYRSHLMFKALPPNKEVSPQAAAATNIHIVLNFAIPVVVQQGELTHQMAVERAAIRYNPQQKTGSVDVELIRSGLHSAMGNLNAYWTPTGGSERLIAKSGDFNFWAELSGARVSLNWVGAEFAPTDGKLRVEYEGTKHFRGQPFFNRTFSISRSMITTM